MKLGILHFAEVNLTMPFLVFGLVGSHDKLLYTG